MSDNVASVGELIRRWTENEANVIVAGRNKYRLHHEVEVGMGFTQPRAEGPRIV